MQKSLNSRCHGITASVSYH